MFWQRMEIMQGLLGSSLLKRSSALSKLFENIGSSGQNAGCGSHPFLIVFVLPSCPWSQRKGVDAEGHAWFEIWGKPSQSLLETLESVRPTWAIARVDRFHAKSIGLYQHVGYEGSLGIRRLLLNLTVYIELTYMPLYHVIPKVEITYIHTMDPSRSGKPNTSLIHPEENTHSLIFVESFWRLTACVLYYSYNRIEPLYYYSGRFASTAAHTAGFWMHKFPLRVIQGNLSEGRLM